MFFPGALLSYFGRVGTSEMNAACIVAFLNLRKYSGTVIRFVKMMFGNCYDSRDLEKFVSMMLMADAEFKEVEKNIKKTIKTSSKYYQRLLLSLLEQ
ncbi:hypothetical protein MHBO_003945 [Bonamia ostreae]|uniref:Uncharacterized protein n=1 Tax=Bonamia ostreae TaxID=126728 RepID=A0ABV2ASS1_9EUKA